MLIESRDYPQLRVLIAILTTVFFVAAAAARSHRAHATCGDDVARLLQALQLSVKPYRRELDDRRAARWRRGTLLLSRSPVVGRLMMLGHTVVLLTLIAAIVTNACETHPSSCGAFGLGQTALGALAVYMVLAGATPRAAPQPRAASFHVSCPRAGAMLVLAAVLLCWLSARSAGGLPTVLLVAAQLQKPLCVNGLSSRSSWE